jgi:hypothetical protein
MNNTHVVGIDNSIAVKVRLYMAVLKITMTSFLFITAR